MALHRRDRVYPPTEPAELLRWQDAGWRRERRGVKRDWQYRQGLFGQMAQRAAQRLPAATRAASENYAQTVFTEGNVAQNFRFAAPNDPANFNPAHPDDAGLGHHGPRDADRVGRDRREWELD